MNRRLFLVGIPLYAAALWLLPPEVRGAIGATAPESLWAVALVTAAAAAVAVGASRPREARPFLRVEGPIIALAPHHGLPRDIAHAAALLAAIPFLWPYHPGLLLVLAAIGLWALQGASREERRTFWIANVVGVFGEWLCVNRLGFWTYTDPLVLGLPLWLVLVWGNLFLLFRRLAMRFDLAWGDVGFIRSVVFAVAAGYFVAATLRVDSAVALAFTAAAGVVLLGPSRHRDLSHFASAALLGLGGEWVGVRAGIWSYPPSAMTLPGMSLPVTLPLAWGLCAVLFAQWSEGRNRP